MKMGASEGLNIGSKPVIMLKTVRDNPEIHSGAHPAPSAGLKTLVKATQGVFMQFRGPESVLVTTARNTNFHWEMTLNTFPSPLTHQNGLNTSFPDPCSVSY